MKPFPIPTTFILVFAMLGLAAAPGFAASKDSPQAPWSVTYQDGSGNGYRFWKDSESSDARFEYSPVRPQESSTGIYSGGEPAVGVLAPKQVEALWQGLARLESDAALRTEARIKGTGSFHIKEASGSREFIIMAGSRLEAWNQSLSAFRRGKQGLIANALSPQARAAVSAAEVNGNFRPQVRLSFLGQ